MWLPDSMHDEYEVKLEGKIVGRATYSKYRQFRVETATDVTNIGKQ